MIRRPPPQHEVLGGEIRDRPAAVVHRVHVDLHDIDRGLEPLFGALRRGLLRGSGKDDGQNDGKKTHGRIVLRI
jgi:hypothetical protein